MLFLRTGRPFLCRCIINSSFQCSKSSLHSSSPKSSNSNILPLKTLSRYMQAEQYDKLGDVISLYDNKGQMIQYFDYYFTSTWKAKVKQKNIKFFIHYHNLALFLLSQCKQLNLSCEIVPHASAFVVWKSMRNHLLSHNSGSPKSLREISDSALTLLYALDLPMRALLLVRIANLFGAPVESISNYSRLIEPKDCRSPVSVDELTNLISSLKVVENFYCHTAKHVLYIDSDDEFAGVTREICEAGKSAFLAIDCEYVVNERNIELLQLAINDRIYLIDCKNIGKDVWEEFVTHIAQNGSLNKLGFDLINEEKMLSEHIGKSVSLIPKTDLKIFSKKIISQLKLCTDRTNIPDYSGGGLLLLTHSVLRKTLDKSVRTSNWKTRPFSQEQLTYGANDAYVCIDIFKRLQLLSKIYPTISESVLSNTKIYLKLADLHDSSKPQLESPAVIDRTTPIVIPPKYEELGRRLRSLGYSNVYFGVVIDTTTEIQHGNRPPIVFNVDPNCSTEEQWSQLYNFVGCQSNVVTHCRYCGDSETMTVTKDMILNHEGTDCISFPTPLRNIDDAILVAKNLKTTNDFKCCVTCGNEISICS